MIELLAPFLLTGLAAGLLAGLFGVGGGLIMVPALALLLPALGVAADVVMHVAIGTSLAVISMTSLSSAWSHHRRGGVLWATLRGLAPGLAVGAVLGAVVADALASDTLMRIVGVGALAVALQMAFGLQPQRDVPVRVPPIAHAGAGGVIGMLSALIGIGGGSLTVPWLTSLGTPMRHAVGTSAAAGVPIAWAGAIAFTATGWDVPGRPPWSLGFVSLFGFAGIAATSVLAAPWGARLAHRLPPAQLQRAFALLLAAIGLKMVWG